MEEKVFPNGFASWQETHFEIVCDIALELSKFNENDMSPVVKKRYELQGRGGMWELAEELTDKFEKMNEGREWNGEWFDEVDAFMRKELSEEK